MCICVDSDVMVDLTWKCCLTNRCMKSYFRRLGPQMGSKSHELVAFRGQRPDVACFKKRTLRQVFIINYYILI
jgi:hypothetical protein